MATQIKRFSFLILIVLLSQLLMGYRQHLPIVQNKGNIYSKVGQFTGLGEVVNWSVGPDSAGASQQIYISYKYYNGTFDLVAVDPYSGNFSVHPGPIQNEWGAQAEVTGPDGNIYLGTLPHAHWVEYNPKTNSMTDLGQPSSTETYIWAATLGTNNKIYGVTYPDAELVQLDPVTHKGSNLGRMDPTQHYARYIVASADGYLYIGIGSAKSTVVAYNIATGQHQAILPYNQAGFAYVFMGNDNKIYAQLPDGTAYVLSGGKATAISPSSLPLVKPTSMLKDGSYASVSRNQITVYQPDGQFMTHTFNYSGKGVDIFRIALGPDGNMYGSTVLPAYLFNVNIASATTPTVKNLGSLPYGEVYSFEKDTTNLYMAGYAYTYPLAAFNPAPPFSGINPTYNHSYVYSDWRPTAMIRDPNSNTIYIGATPGYGKLGGPLVKWNPGTNTIQQYTNIVTDQSLYSLTLANGQLIGGTTIYGGTGSTPTQKSAALFVWNPATHTKTYQTIPLASATYISNLITAPNGLVYGFANSTLFTFNPTTHNVTIIGTLPTGSYVYNLLNNMAISSQGSLWGLSTTGIFTINTTTNKLTMYPSPVSITGGMVFIPNRVSGDKLYFSSGSYIYVYYLPRA